MKKYFLVLYLSILLSACASGQNTAISLPKVDTNLPTLTHLQYMSSKTAIAFEWKSMYDAPIDGIYIYKATDSTQPLKLIATITNKYKTHFIDEGMQPNEHYFYLFKTFNSFGQIASNAASIEAYTKPRMEAIPFIQSIPGLAGTTKLIWRPHPNPSVDKYIIQRAGRDGVFTDYASVDNRLSAEFIDQGLKPNESFSYRIYAVSFKGILSEPSMIVKSTTKALPPKVQHLRASQDMAKKIVLSWDSLPNEDFAYFNIYKKSDYLGETLIAKSIKNTFSIAQEGPNEHASFAVSEVDKDGLEGPKSDFVVGKSASLPKPPVLIMCLSNPSGIKVEWIKSDERAASYELKRSQNGPDLIIKDIKQTSFEDSSADPKKVYEYEVRAIDKDSLASPWSKAMKSSVK